MAVRILAADDNASTLEAIVNFLQEEQHRVVGSAKDGSELVRQVLLLQPEIIVTDMFMPVKNGLEALSELRKQSKCSAKFIFLSAHRQSEFVVAALNAGAEAYVLKHRMVTDLPAAIEAILRGERYLSPSLQSAHGPANLAKTS